MKDKKLENKVLDIESLKLSPELKDKLKTSSLESEAEFNYFRISDLKQLLGEEFFEIVKKEILVPYKLPYDFENLEIDDPDFDAAMKKLGAKNARDLIKIKRADVQEAVKNDLFVLQSVNKILEFFGIPILVVQKEDVQESIPATGASAFSQVEEPKLDPKQRLTKVVPSIRGKLADGRYSHFKIRLASPNEIKQWSYGEIKSPETINYRSGKPVKDGLFCEKIFGPTKDYQCDCGKKQSGNAGTVCEKCGIEITSSKVRRERMGHIALAAPVVHPWYLKNSPSKLATLLNIKAKNLEEIVFYIRYVIMDPGHSGRQKGETLPEKEYFDLYEQEIMKGSSFYGKTGATAIQELLRDLNLETAISKVKEELTYKTSKQVRQNLIKRLSVLEAFYNSDNKPEWMVLSVLPVIPPDLRPMVALDGGRYATTDLNDLYRHIISRNERLKKIQAIEGPALLVKNEMRLLQEAVDALFDSSAKHGSSQRNPKNPLKSLSEVLKGKQGRFRQNLLGKRVDYSGRSVIIIGPDLEMYQCGVPREMAYTLFKPFILQELEKRYPYDEKTTEKTKKINPSKLYDQRRDECYDILEQVVREHPVLLNRAPTLHRLGIQAFEPKLIDGKAIRLHPLVTTAFNADFDGDQMAIHLPLSSTAQAEARYMMLASNNILSPSSGKPIVTPTQDMVVGNYYLTKEENSNKIHFFNSIEEAEVAKENGIISLQERLFIKPKHIDSYFTEEQKEKYLVTTLGKLLFNKILPNTFPYFNAPKDIEFIDNTPDIFFYSISSGIHPTQFLKELPLQEPFKKKTLSAIIGRVFKECSLAQTSYMLDRLKDLGFKYSTESGLSISFSDVKVYSNKEYEINEANKKVELFENQLQEGLISHEVKTKNVLDIWEATRKKILKGLMDEFDKQNNIYIMMDSGARGSDNHFSQLAGMRGLMNNPKNETIEVPIISSFREGLTVSEFFISTHGARKGSTDTALKTSKSGYLTRRLVDVAQDIIISEEDCGTDRGFKMKAIIDSKDASRVIVPLSDRIAGRYSAKTIKNPENGDVIVEKGDLISDENAKKIEKLGITEVEIRSTLACASENGVCAKCYGKNLATNTAIEVGEAVGVIAAQSIGEPGTQLTMRTFHTGGVASAADITQGLPRVEELFEARTPKGKATIVKRTGKVTDIKDEVRLKRTIVTIKTTSVSGKEEDTYEIPLNSCILEKKQEVKAGDKITVGSIHPKELFDYSTREAVEAYIMDEVQTVYRGGQGVIISDKHIELIIRQMFKRVVVQDQGETSLFPGLELSVSEYRRNLKKAVQEGKKLPVAFPVMYGIAKAAGKSDSFLSAASFQETTKVLTDAAICGKIDELVGLKENAIIGGLIPAGTGAIERSFILANSRDDK